MGAAPDRPQYQLFRQTAAGLSASAIFHETSLHQCCAIHKSRNLQRHLAKPYRKGAHRKLTTALEQMRYAEAKHMLLELEAWLRTKNESAADSLLETFEEMLTLHRLKVPAWLRQTLMSTNPIESMFSIDPAQRAEHETFTREHDAPVLAGDRVAVLRAAVQARERLCRDGAGHCDHRGRARGAAVRSDNEGCVKQPLEPLRKFQRTC